MEEFIYVSHTSGWEETTHENFIGLSLNGRNCNNDNDNNN